MPAGSLSDRGRNREKHGLNRHSNKLSMWLKCCCPHHSQSHLAFALAVECRHGPLQEVRLNLMLLNHLFYWNAKKKARCRSPLFVLPPAEEEGILFASQCRRSNPTGVDNTRGVRRWLRALGWSSGSWTCSAAALTPACMCAPRRSSASPPHQALGITSIGTDTLPMATSNLFKALEAECWLRGLPWLTGFTPFFH